LSAFCLLLSPRLRSQLAHSRPLIAPPNIGILERLAARATPGIEDAPPMCSKVIGRTARCGREPRRAPRLTFLLYKKELCLDLVTFASLSRRAPRREPRTSVL
jgi:hypothetical protein